MRRDGVDPRRARFERDGYLYQGQTVDRVNEAAAVPCALLPGEASFHHGWSLHASGPNRSGERRIGFNAQYIATHVRQTQHVRDTAMLVHGVGVDVPASADLDPGAVARQGALERMVRETMDEGRDGRYLGAPAGDP